MNPPHQRDKNIIYTSKLLFNLQIHNFMKKTLNINTKNDYENEINEISQYLNIKGIFHFQFINFQSYCFIKTSK